MKRVLTITLVALVAMAAPMMAGIDGSAHDLGDDSLGSTEICIYCHTPHNPVINVPLWNHNAPTATYAVYTSATMNASLSNYTQTANFGANSGISALCLSCHDGTIALGNIKNPRGSTMSTQTMIAKFPSSTAVLGTDLTNDHPVGFQYGSTLINDDGELKTPTGGIFAGGKVKLFGGSKDQVECASCHDVHTPGEGDTSPFLVQSMASSGLCFECHAK